MYTSATGSYPREISVEGEGKAFVTPDTAQISLGVYTEAKESQDAVSQNTEKVNKIILSLAEFGIAKEDIKTSNFNLYPKYNWTEDRGSVQDGYTLNQTVEVKIKDFQKIGDVIAKSAELGANTIGSVQFVIDDMTTAKEEARAEAIKKAKENAEKIAEQTGLRLGKVLNFWEYQDDYYPQPMYSNASSYREASGLGGGEMMEAPYIEPGQDQITLKVNLSYRVY